jgi:hypothetical protein
LSLVGRRDVGGDLLPMPMLETKKSDIGCVRAIVYHGLLATVTYGIGRLGGGDVHWGLGLGGVDRHQLIAFAGR